MRRVKTTLGDDDEILVLVGQRLGIRTQFALQSLSPTL